MTEIRQSVEAVVHRVLLDSGRATNPLSDGDELAQTIGLSSLDIAVVVVALEQQLGIDPFRKNVPTVRTFGDLVTLYENAVKN